MTSFCELSHLDFFVSSTVRSRFGPKSSIWTVVHAVLPQKRVTRTRIYVVWTDYNESDRLKNMCDSAAMSSVWTN